MRSLLLAAVPHVPAGLLSTVPAASQDKFVENAQGDTAQAEGGGEARAEKSKATVATGSRMTVYFIRVLLLCQRGAWSLDGLVCCFKNVRLAGVKLTLDAFDNPVSNVRSHLALKSPD